VPAAAVIPAPGVSMVNAAVKRSVVGCVTVCLFWVCVRCSVDVWGCVCKGRGVLDSWARGEM